AHQLLETGTFLCRAARSGREHLCRSSVGDRYLRKRFWYHEAIPTIQTPGAICDGNDREDKRVRPLGGYQRARCKLRRWSLRPIWGNRYFMPGLKLSTD